MPMPGSAAMTAADSDSDRATTPRIPNNLVLFILSPCFNDFSRSARSIRAGANAFILLQNACSR